MVPDKDRGAMFVNATRTKSDTRQLQEVVRGVNKTNVVLDHKNNKISKNNNNKEKGKDNERDRGKESDLVKERGQSKGTDGNKRLPSETAGDKNSQQVKKPRKEKDKQLSSSPVRTTPYFVPIGPVGISPNPSRTIVTTTTAKVGSSTMKPGFVIRISSTPLSSPSSKDIMKLTTTMTSSSYNDTLRVSSLLLIVLFPLHALFTR